MCFRSELSVSELISFREADCGAFNRPRMQQFVEAVV
jgi:hypothetical protein